MTRTLTWFLIRYARTVSLMPLELAIRDELDLRARRAAIGLPSPNQRPPAELLFAALIVAAAFLALRVK